MIIFLKLINLETEFNEEIFSELQFAFDGFSLKSLA